MEIEIEIIPVLPKPYPYRTATDWACKKNTLETDKLNIKKSILNRQQNQRFVKLQADILKFKDDFEIARMQKYFTSQTGKRETSLKRWSSLKDETNSKTARTRQSAFTIDIKGITDDRDTDCMTRYGKVFNRKLNPEGGGSDSAYSNDASSVQSKPVSIQDCYQRVIAKSRAESKRLDNLERRYSLHLELDASQRIRKRSK